MIIQISDEYYSLITFPSVPNRVFKALTECSTGTIISSSLAKFQLGLCYVSGFGTSIDPHKGLTLIHEAATLGLQRARTDIARFHRAFGIPIPYSSRETFFSWLSESAHLGSRTAVYDLTVLFPDIPSWHKGSSALHYGRWCRKLVALCDVVRQGRRAEISPEDVSIGPNGDSILHWCAFLDRDIGGSVAALLMDHGCTPTTVTRTECPLNDSSDGILHCEAMPSRTTPIDWAIIENNMEVLKVLLQADQINRDTRGATIESPAFTPATCAARFQRIECLKYILESGYDSSECDETGCAPMFYAARPDMFARILRFSDFSNVDLFTQGGNMQQPVSYICPPFLRLEIDILQLLQDHGATLEACREDEFNYLHLTVVAKDSRVLEHLLRTESLGNHINQRARGEWSPLGFAIALGNERAIGLLLAYGADINDLSPLQGYNALHICAIYARPNSAEIASKLVNRSRNLVNSRSRSGYTALHFAAVAGSALLINILTTRGAHLLAASNLITPLGLAIAYWSELGVEKMCSIHMEKGVPLIAAFEGNPGDLSLCHSIRPLNMILAPGRESAMNRVRDFRGRSSQIGCYDPPLCGPAENIVRIILQYPASGRCVEYFKTWYYQVRQQYSSTDGFSQGYSARVLRILSLLLGFMFGSLWFILYGIDEIYDAIIWAMESDDSRAVEIILAESSQRKSSKNLRPLILNSQIKLTYKPVHGRQNALRTAALLIDLENHNYSQLKLRRTNGRIRILWRLIYFLYLDVEEKEYMRFNEWVVHERPDMSRLKSEFRSWFCSLRIPIYPISFVTMWAILGQMLYQKSNFQSNFDEALPASSRIGTIFLVIAVSTVSRHTDIG